MIKKKKTSPTGEVYTCIEGRNNNLISDVLSLYAKPGFVIGDVTFGKGAFWDGIDLSPYRIIGSDIVSKADALKTHTKYCKNLTLLWNVDFCHLPYKDKIFDMIFFDPPYTHNPGTMLIESMYRNAQTTKRFNHKDIVDLYREGIQEAKRVLKIGGFLCVKCRDEIESSRQCWAHREVYDIATTELGMYPKDLFILKQMSYVYIQHKTQQHARKNHSYLWVFIKTTSMKFYSR